MYQIGREAGIEREYVNPSKAFLDSLAPDSQIAPRPLHFVLRHIAQRLHGRDSCGYPGGSVHGNHGDHIDHGKYHYQDCQHIVNPMDGELIADITALEGVERVDQVKYFGVRFDFPQRDEYGSNDVIYPLTAQETDPETTW